MTEFPKNWQFGQLGAYCTVQGGFAFKSKDFIENGIPLVRISNIKDQSIDFGECVYLDKSVLRDFRRFLLKRDDILIAMSGATTGKTGIYSYDTPALLNQRVGRFIITDDNNLFQDFLRQIVFQYSFIKKVLIDADGAAQPNISPKQIESIKIVFPSLPEQQKIAEILSTIDEAIENSNAIIKETQQLKKGLMQKLFTEGIGHTRFKKTKIGMIPEEWDLITLKTMMEKKIIVGHLDGNHGALYPRSDEFVENGIPYLIANCLINGQVDFNYAKFLAPEKASTLRKGFAKDMDVLFAHNATVGPVGILRTELDYVILSTSLTYYRCDQKRLSPHYLYHFMGSQFFTKQFKRVMGQSTRNQVPITAQRAFYHIIPPKEEQKEFVSILSEVDSKIINEQNTKAELEQLKKGLMQILLTGKVRVKV